jgi:hypothetical protein
MSTKPIQTQAEIEANVRAFQSYIEPTKFFLLSDPKTMTVEQIETAQVNGNLFNHWLVKNKSTEAGVDFSVQSIKEAYVALRNAGLIHFEVAPNIRKTSQLTDAYGRPIRDLRQERKDAAERAAEEAKQPRKTIESAAKDAMQRAEANKRLEQLRDTIASYRASSHSKSAAARAEMTEALNKVLKGNRSIYDVIMLETEVRAIGKKYWDKDN